MDINDECFCKECILLSRAIKKMGSLFIKRVSDRPTGEVYNNSNLFAITINLSPFKSMNKKKWFTYTHDKQIDILTRIESKFRQLTPSVKMLELHFELAPTTCKNFNNMHIHALYDMPELFVSEMETYYNRICKDTTSNCEHLKIDKVYDKEGWLRYIRKDI